MSTAFPAKNGLTFTKYLCLIEFVSRYPSTFLIILSPIIKIFFFILFVNISFTASFDGFSFEFNCKVLLFCCCCCCCCGCCCSCSFEILFALCSNLSLLLVSFCSMRLLVKLFVLLQV